MGIQKPESGIGKAGDNSDQPGQFSLADIDGTGDSEFDSGDLLAGAGDIAREDLNNLLNLVQLGRGSDADLDIQAGSESFSLDDMTAQEVVADVNAPAPVLEEPEARDSTRDPDGLLAQLPLELVEEEIPVLTSSTGEDRDATLARLSELTTDFPDQGEQMFNDLEGVEERIGAISAV